MNVSQVSIIIPAHRAEKTLGACLDGLAAQMPPREFEIIVIADEESANAARAIAEPHSARVLTPNRSAAAARNLGTENARGDIVLFIDADCVPEKTWVDAMLAPFSDSEIVGAGGMKRTHQRSIMPRFIQLEFDYRYDRERVLRDIDFIDSGTAAYRRAIFLQHGGFDTKLSDAEDVDLSYRLSEQGYRMAFAENAIVYHPHPESLLEFLKRKFVYAYWRSQVYARHPHKITSDSRTPQTQKLQGVLAGLFTLTTIAAVVWSPMLWLAAANAVIFFLTTLPLVAHYWQRDPLVALLAPFITALAAFAGGAGIALGLVRRKTL